MIPEGVSGKCLRTSSAISESGIWPVPSVSTWTLTGSETPMA